MTETIDLLVEGGKANAGPPLGPTLAQKKMNVVEVVAAINEKTKSFNGMQVPVKLLVEDDNSFEIEVGSPPVSALIKKEMGVEKMRKIDDEGNVTLPGDIELDKLVEIAKNKDNIAGDLTNRVLQILGTCLAGGVTVNGKNARSVQKDIKAGKIKIS